VCLLPRVIGKERNVNRKEKENKSMSEQEWSLPGKYTRIKLRDSTALAPSGKEN